jgi:hypothetical protein
VLTIIIVKDGSNFPDGVAFDGNRFSRTAATEPFFNHLALSEESSGDKKFGSC